MQTKHTAHGLRFTIAVVPDTQNYVSYRNQREAGFPFNAREILWDMMHYIARNAVKHGGEIAFATGLGDMWEHQLSFDVDAEHAARGDKSVANPLLEALIPPSPEQVVNIEIPAITAAWQILDGVLPFCVIPGNHDHDHMWTDANHPPREGASFAELTVANVGSVHCGGLTNWKANFGAHTPIFRNKPWYVASFREGANSAQIFTGATHRFLHLGLEMAPDADVIAWAESVIAAFPGVPTIVSIHEFLNGNGERAPLDCFDLSRLDPERHNPGKLWDRFVARHDQILCVLNGHFHGARHRMDENQHGHQVMQFLSNYQSRKQSVRGTAPQTPVIDGIGDGWIRLMEFDLKAECPTLRLRAYSTYFKAFASDLPDYATWYREEHPDMPADEFRALDDFTVPLVDFHQRFAHARIDRDEVNDATLARHA
ncbi:hypothetical protein PCO31110_01319 [Pandoraea communis]|uniref:Serine/threonine protein phosphatase n=1 Tax=Pandoraea communis TaxID=2508297 RepID=A0A5E4TAQ0_9BURK|nr:serine/threonine protein phosphatase [Pandoraea communis]VVD85210.1 hypothetical protein PCO31110_01319 [Pandoraea communis]